MTQQTPESSQIAPIPVYFSCDENYIPYLCVAMVSVLKNTTSPVHFIVLHAGLSDEGKKIVASVCIGQKLNFVDVTQFEALLDGLSMKQAHISLTACFRYFMPVLDFPYEKGIYLDCDLLVRGDIRRLYDTDIGDYFLAAADDFQKKRWKRKLSLARYFNSGVLLLNLKKLREARMTEMLLKKTFELRDIIKYLDQDVLNIVFKDKVLFLPPCWNAVSPVFRKQPRSEFVKKEELLDAAYDPAIIHFTGPDKPWKIPYGLIAHPWAPSYFYYMRQTPCWARVAGIFRAFKRVPCFFWYWRRHLFFFLRPQFYRMRVLYRRNLKQHGKTETEAPLWR